MKQRFSFILTAIKKANIKSLVTWPIVIGLIFLISSLAIGEKAYQKQVPDAYIAVIGILSSFIFSFSGIFQILRREGPGPLGKPVKGFWPILMGSVWLTFTWVLGLFLLYQLLLEIIMK